MRWEGRNKTKPRGLHQMGMGMRKKEEKRPGYDVYSSVCRENLGYEVK
jgi:hypothetical protein